MKLLKKLLSLTNPFEVSIENALVATWSWLIKQKYSDQERFIDIVAVGMAENKTIYAKGFCPTTVGPHVKRPGIVLRSMAESKVVMEKGPMPAIQTHQLVLFTLPSFWVRGSLKSNQQFFKDWEGTTEAFGLPFCFYTLMR